jgi:YVTN family beta-propeller protein
MNTFKLNKRTLGMSVISSIAVILLFASPSVLMAGAVAPAANVNCTTTVCAYVENYGSGTVSAINGTKAFKTISTGSGPVGQEGYDPTAGLVCVPNGGASSGPVSLINAATQKVKQVSSSKYDYPSGCVYDPAANSFLVANFDAGTLSVINATSMKALSKTISVGGSSTLPEFLSYSPVNGEVYVSLVGVAEVYVINGATYKHVKTLTVGSDPRGIAFDPANNNTYVANEGSADLSVISSTNHVKTLSISGMSVPWGVNYGNGNIYVADLGASAVFIISSTNKAHEVTGFTEGPVMGAYDAANGYEYVTMVDNGQVWILHGTKLLRKTITVGSEPQGIITT